MEYMHRRVAGIPSDLAAEVEYEQGVDGECSLVKPFHLALACGAVGVDPLGGGGGVVVFNVCTIDSFIVQTPSNYAI